MSSGLPALGVRLLQTATGVVAADQGPRSGAGVVIVPSLGTTQRSYDAVAEWLVAAGYRVIRPDIRGHGRSAESEPVTTIDDLAEDLVLVLDRAELETANVLGCSVGAMASIRFAANWPDRCDRLILTGADSSFRPANLWHDRIELVTEQGMAGLADGAVDRWVTASTRVDRPEAVAILRRDLLSLDVAVFVRYATMMSTADVEPDLDRITATVAVLVGENDPSSPVDAARRLADAFGCRAPLIVPEANHLLHLDDEAALIEAVAAVLETAV